MFKKVLFWIVTFSFFGLQAQEIDLGYSKKKIAFSTDTIYLETVSINSHAFKIVDANNKSVDSTFYQINFPKAYLLFKNQNYQPTDSLTVYYRKFPEALTKEYFIYDTTKIIDNNATTQNLYKIETNSIPKAIPFDGINAFGSLSRGVFVGNNQNAVVNSKLDFQITGKISDKVSIRASIQDTNIPVQEGSYSQRLNQYDAIFIELFTDNWNVRGGDVFIGNNNSRFLSFNKKIQGLSANINWENEKHKSNAFISGGLVTGTYSSSTFTGQEGNQGPYKLIGKNGELYVLVIIGSERVYVNGVLLERGENKDYLIDYNSGEIVFNPQFPITSEMRIAIEYQYSENNYTRFITYDGGSFSNKKWDIGAAIYSESDLKDQPIQQNLTTEQAQILADAGDNTSLMIAPSAVPDTYDATKIQYKQIQIGTNTIYEYSTIPNDTLYNVQFTLIGPNKGNYILTNPTSVDKIFEYVTPINGILQGNYEPIMQLFAPVKVQVANFFGKYNPSKKTKIEYELAISQNDQNLFSPLNDDNNQGLSGQLFAKQQLYAKKWSMDAFANFQAVEANFKPVERINNIEFYRDWNINTLVIGDQSLLETGFNLNLIPIENSQNKANITYTFQKLALTDAYSGIKNNLNAGFEFSNWNITNDGSYLKSDTPEYDTNFLRNFTHLKYKHKKNWVGSTIRLEDNQEKNKTTQLYSQFSQRFSEYGIYTGHGDSTKVYVQMGYVKRVNDSVQNGLLERVSISNNYNFQSNLFKTENSDLSLFINYRQLNFTDPTIETTLSLNSKLMYNDQFFNKLIQSNTLYQTNSGTMPFQDYTYVEVPAGQGKYTWNDYNGNGIKDLEEFEIAPFPDLAIYTRIFLPNQTYIKTNHNRFLQSFIINPSIWQNKSNYLKKLSNFYFQSSFITERKIKNSGEQLKLNPFDSSDEVVIGLLQTFTNSLAFNRGKRKHSTTYTFTLNEIQNLISIGTIQNNNNFHQLQYQHLIKNTWLLDLQAKTIHNESNSLSFPEKNYTIEGYLWTPRLSYLFNKNFNLDFFYEYDKKENKIGSFETLVQNQFGTSFNYIGKEKYNANGELSFYNNEFVGNEFSSAGYQILEGLQQGKNITWRSLLQLKLTKFLDLNFVYQGRKSETSDAIHTGSIELKAYF